MMSRIVLFLFFWTWNIVSNMFQMMSRIVLFLPFWTWNIVFNMFHMMRRIALFIWIWKSELVFVWFSRTVPSLHNTIYALNIKQCSKLNSQGLLRFIDLYSICYNAWRGELNLFFLDFQITFKKCRLIKLSWFLVYFDKFQIYTVKPLITNTPKEFIKCRILHFLIMECCRFMAIYLFSQIPKFT